MIDPVFLRETQLELVDTIGRGCFSRVYLVYSREYKQKFALKIIGIKEFNENEVDALIDIICPYVTRLYRYYLYNDKIYLLMEYCPETVVALMHNGVTIENEPLCLKIAYEVLTALKYCHSHNVSHGDIKPSNLFIDSFGRTKIGDFGVSVINNKEICSSDIHGSLVYMSPEVQNKMNYNRFKADIWSFGISLYEIYCGHGPWFGLMDEEALDGNLKIDFSPIKSQKIRRIVEMCLNYNPNMRPSAEKLLDFDFTSGNCGRNARAPHKTAASIIKPHTGAFSGLLKNLPKRCLMNDYRFPRTVIPKVNSL